LHSKGGTGFQPVQAQAEACGYINTRLIATRYERLKSDASAAAGFTVEVSL
jgi:hypothetical protein